MAKPPPVEKKSGRGCCGCGCFLVVILAFIFGALMGVTGLLVYDKAVEITSTTPAIIPSFDGGDDVYNRTVQKMKDFDHDVHDHLAATVRLSADEINTMIAHNPSFAGNKIHLYVALSGDQAHVQTSAPSDLLAKGYILKDRYLYGDMTCSLNFDSTAKTLNLDLKSFLMGKDAAPKENLPMIQSIINPMLNQMLQRDQESKNVLDQATSIQIENSELVIETK